MRTPALSVVVVAYEMRREIVRTVQSLSPSMQRGIDADEYEILVVDNGSSEPVDAVLPAAADVPLRVLRIDDASPSPVAAVNRGLAAASAPLVGVMIDGARLASPGLLHHARLAARLHERPVVATVAFHLGPDAQPRSVAEGYDTEAEDRLLESVDWTADGYRLFEISVFAKSSGEGWFGEIAESNALFLPRALWDELGGYDEAFASPGGGFVNLDTYARACALPDTQVVFLFGEGTFHQVHGGVATNAIVSPVAAYAAEYARIRGMPFRRPRVRPLLLGTPPRHALATIAACAQARATL